MTNEPADATHASPDADTKPSAAHQAPEDDTRGRPGDPPILEGVDRGGTGEPVGPDNLREGRAGGLMGGPHPSQGQGQGG